MFEEIKKVVSEAKAGADFEILKAPDFTGADYAVPVARQIQSKEEFISKLLKSGIFEEVKIAGVFVNVKLAEQFILRKILEKPAAPKKKGRVIIEFVSANPTGLLHIGHLRGAVIGGSLAAILAERGWDVIKEYYVNDRGRQIKLLVESVLAVKAGKKPPEGGYSGREIEEISLKISNENEEEIARIAVEEILARIKETLKKTGIEFDNFFSEKKLYETGKVEEILSLLKRKNAVFEKDGALWLNVSADDKDRVLVKSNGEATYFLSDIAYHWDKFSRSDFCINIWGADHHGYVSRLKEGISLMGIKAENLKIVLYQLVRLARGGEAFKMSKRQGTYVLAEDVIREVGSDAVKYFLASRKPQAQMDFDVDLAKKSSKENPVYYIQYAHARICSVFKKAEEAKLQPSPPQKLLRQERAVVLKALEIEDIFALCEKDLSPHHLALWLLELATLFHNFYDHNRIITDDENYSSQRLFVAQKIKQTLARGLASLGISAPSKM